MSARAPSLLEVQRALLASVAGDGCEAPLSQMIDDVDPAACLAIYRNTSLSTLATALSLTSWSGRSAARCMRPKPRRSIWIGWPGFRQAKARGCAWSRIRR